ncbi:MAG: DEAD/DEAH box helicase, partial [Chloroflexi bacterium]
MTEPIYVEIAVNVPQVSGLFHYHLPPDLTGQVVPGCLVIVPFGNRHVQGIILRLLDRPEVIETRPVEAVLDSQAILTPAQMQLARWLSETYLSPLAVCFSPMIPPGLGQQADTLFHLNVRDLIPSKPGSLQQRLFQLLKQRGDLRGRQIDAALPHLNWRPAARAMVKQGWLAARPVLQPPSVRPKMVRTVQLACSPQTIEARLESLGRAGSAALERRQAILRFLLQEGLPVDAPWVYAVSGGNLQDLQKLEEAGLVILGESETWRDPLDRVKISANEALILTEDQQKAWESVLSGLQTIARGDPPPAPYLLHGITGSGKTEVYMRAVAEVLRMGKQAAILVPEIALTPQTVRRFLGRFPGQVGLIHSRLSDGERYDTWRRARSGALPVIVGPRSALFAPLPNLGLIILDECHDPAYHQEDVQPNYNAVEAAIAYARLANCLLILGSATPDISLYYRALQERWSILKLPVRILAHRQTIEAQLSQMRASVPTSSATPGNAAEST